MEGCAAAGTLGSLFVMSWQTDPGRQVTPSWVWQRWMRWWPAVFGGLLVVSCISWVSDRGADASLAAAGVPATALVAWGIAWITEVRRDRPRGVWTLPLLAIVGTALSILLTQTALVFWIVGLALVPMFFVILPLPWAIGAAMLLAAHVGWAARAVTGVGPLSSVEVAAFLLSRGIVLVLLGLFMRSVVWQSARLQRLSDALDAARSDLAAAERHAGVLEERHRVARELHDTVSQGLSAAILHIETAEQALPDVPASAEQMRRARAVARESLEDMRRVVGAMRPEVLEHAELPEAIRRVVTRWSERTGVPARYQVSGVPAPLLAEADITLLRAAQEALANVWKHARASQAAVSLTYMGDAVALDVRDDGCGLGSAQAPGTGTGFGLTAMRERVHGLGGTVTLESDPGAGTTVSVSLPTWQTAERSAATGARRS